MRGKKWLILVISLAVVLLASSIGVTRGSFIDLESSSGNTLQAWVSNKWVQTTEADFEAGVLSNVDTSSSPGDVKLEIVPQEPTSNVGSEEAWSYASWNRRVPITINNSGSNLTDYQVRVDVTYDADMQPDFDDIRFVDSDDATQLSHWRESYTASTSATFWVKVPSIPSGAKTIYMYYGNAAASSASDGTATFLFYDDFEGGSLDTKWTLVSDAYAPNWPFSSPANYTYDGAKIEVSGGYAQLVKSSSPAWYDTNWSYRKQISIDYMKVVADLADFPVLISLPSDADLAADAQSDGDDILFTSSNGITKLSHEIESFNGTTGNLTAWVKVPSLSSLTDTDIYMYYGNASASNQQNVTGTWDSSYVMVQHLQETSGSHYDSTQYGNNGTASVTVQGSATGKMDGADQFNGTNNYVEVATSNWNAGSGTVELWGYATVLSDHRYFFGHTTVPAYANRIQLYTNTVDGNLALGLGDAHDRNTFIQALAINTWYHIVLTWDGSAYVVYVDGVSKANGPYTGLSTIYSFADIGNDGNASERTEAFDGILDEVRVSNTVRTAAWIETSYNNQSDPSTFYSMGAETVPSYPSDAPTIQPTTGQPYTELFTFAETLGPANQGAVKYQISNDGTSWYYHNGLSWVAATGFAQTNTAAEVNANISSFDNDVGTGTFYFKAFLSGDGTQQVQLDQISIETDGFWSRATDQKHSGTYALKAGVVSDSNRYISATGINQADVAFDAWWYNTATNPDICQNVRASTSTPLTDYHINWEGQWTIAEMPWNSLNSVAGSLPQNTWFKMTVIIQGTSMKVLKDDVQINPTSGWLNVGTKYASGSIGFRSWSASNNWWLDDVKVRKYADPEPTTSLGSEETWYDTSWGCRAPVTINNPGSGLTDYQVKVDVTYDADIQPDFDDIRFVDSDDSTALSHWRESYTASTSATFWVKVPSIPSGSKTIYMYYGNAAASSASDGNATFVFFDDFDDASLGADWTFSQVGGAVGSYTESGTVIRLTGTDTGDLWDSSDKFLFLSISGNYDNVLIESYTPAWGGTHGTWSKMGGVQLRQSVDAGSKNRIMSPVFSATGATNSYRVATGGITDEQTTTTSPKYNRVSRSGGTSRAWYSTDGITWTELGSEISFTGGLTDPVCLGIHLAGLSTAAHWVEVDWFRVRKYAQPISVSSGTIASQVHDTGVAGARWDALFWDETLQSNTDITFEVRASDTSFAKDAATPSWTPVGGASPVTSGLPSGRYMQWRATLSTSDISKTPTLHEVRVYHY